MSSSTCVQRHGRSLVDGRSGRTAPPATPPPPAASPPPSTGHLQNRNNHHYWWVTAQGWGLISETGAVLRLCWAMAILYVCRRAADASTGSVLSLPALACVHRNHNAFVADQPPKQAGYWEWHTVPPGDVRPHVKPLKAVCMPCPAWPCLEVPELDPCKDNHYIQRPGATIRRG